MRTLTRTTAILGTAGLVAAGLAAAAPANAASDVVRIKVTEVETSFDQSWGRHDVPEAGDHFEFTSNLRQDGKRVGKDAGECKFLKIYGDADDPDSAKIKCDITFRFFGTGLLRAIGTKTIDWDDLVNDDVDVTIPIRSGTGRFDDAEGTVRNNQVNEKKTQLTFRLTHVDCNSTLC